MGTKESGKTILNRKSFVLSVLSLESRHIAYLIKKVANVEILESLSPKKRI